MFVVRAIFIIGIVAYLILIARYIYSTRVLDHDKKKIIDAINKDGLFY